ncbi:uncharacterized protein LOC131034876 isoform X1 [Cryptomeria japonica]|uniref:uncharacterized protein LOC131034876 isoform X1 n=1 Tax=Cryptomeria japonica TaxID=3369 RepID=UPI0027D9F356|nr:uncharacterized protein LOC131034876 isoform X1 [Cryptomeria japonica]XP_057822464.2 uncharacterized protein LOC131034876 isoform X1 [Cryptomeria japonica]
MVAVGGLSNIAENVIDAEAKLKPAQDKTLKLKEELMLAKEKERKMYFLELKQNKVEKEKEDVLTEWERLKNFESKARRLTRELIDSEFFRGRFTNLGQFRDDPNLLDKLKEVTVALKERDLILHEQFQDAECKRTELEDKSNMELDLLSQEKMHSALQEDELKNAVARLNMLEMNSTCFEEKVPALEGSIKFLMNKNKECDELAKQAEDNFVETFKRALESDYLQVIYESRANEMQKILTKLEEEIEGLHQKLKKCDQVQQAMNKMEANHFKIEEEFNCFQNYSLERVKNFETALLNSRQKEQERQENLISAEQEVCNYKNIAKKSTERLFEVQNLAEVLEGLLKDTQEKWETVERDMKRVSQRELVLQSKLEDYEVKFLAQESTLQSMTARIKELKQLLESQVNGPEKKFKMDQEKSAFSEGEDMRMLNTLVGHVRESNNQVSVASKSAIAKDIELQILYAKLTEMETLVQQIQGKFLTAEDRALHAEAERTQLFENNLKLSDEFAHIQFQMVELQTTLNRVESKEVLATNQLMSTVKRINGLTGQLRNERQDLHNKISILVKDNSNLNEKYMSVKKEYQVLSSKHESELKKVNQREEILKEKLLDLKTKPGKRVDLDAHLAGLEQMTRLVKKESQQHLKSEDLHLESKPINSGDLQKSYVRSDLMHLKMKSPGACQTGNVFDNQTIGNFHPTGLFSLNFISILMIILLSVFTGLIIGRSY